MIHRRLAASCLAVPIAGLRARLRTGRGLVPSSSAARVLRTKCGLHTGADGGQDGGRDADAQHLRELSDARGVPCCKCTHVQRRCSAARLAAGRLRSGLRRSDPGLRPALLNRWPRQGAEDLASTYGAHTCPNKKPARAPAAKAGAKLSSMPSVLPASIPSRKLRKVGEI